MARITYVAPEEKTDLEMCVWLEEARAAGNPGPENQSIHAHNSVVIRSFTRTRLLFLRMTGRRKA